jgi:hypothetical protein
VIAVVVVMSATAVSVSDLEMSVSPIAMSALVMMTGVLETGKVESIPAEVEGEEEGSDGVLVAILLPSVSAFVWV